MKVKKRKSNVISISSDSDTESSEIHPIKRRRVSLNNYKLQQLTNDMKDIKVELSKAFTLTKCMKVPLALRRLLYETFRCSICRSTPMNPPVIFAKCCKTILGCQQCVDRWYRGEEGQQRTCPSCREPRAYVETMKINGLDDFLTGIQPIFAENEGDEDTE